MRQFSLLSIHALADKFEVFGPQTSLFLTADYWTTDSAKTCLLVPLAKHFSTFTSNNKPAGSIGWEYTVLK